MLSSPRLTPGRRMPSRSPHCTLTSCSFKTVCDEFARDCLGGSCSSPFALGGIVAFAVNRRRELDVFGKLVMKLELDRAVALESDHGEDKTHVFAHVRRPSRAHVHENLRSGVTASQSHL